MLILRLLQKTPMYGYQIVEAIRTESKDFLNLGEGVVYTVLHSLERDGALKSHRKAVDGRSRIYYTLTSLGMKRYSDLVSSWTSLADVIRTIIEGDKDAATA